MNFFNAIVKNAAVPKGANRGSATGPHTVQPMVTTKDENGQIVTMTKDEYKQKQAAQASNYHTRVNYTDADQIYSVVLHVHASPLASVGFIAASTEICLKKGFIQAFYNHKEDTKGHEQLYVFTSAKAVSRLTIEKEFITNVMEKKLFDLNYFIFIGGYQFDPSNLAVIPAPPQQKPSEQKFEICNVESDKVLSVRFFNKLISEEAVLYALVELFSSLGFNLSSVTQDHCGQLSLKIFGWTNTNNISRNYIQTQLTNKVIIERKFPQVHVIIGGIPFQQ